MQKGFITELGAMLFALYLKIKKIKCEIYERED